MFCGRKLKPRGGPMLWDLSWEKGDEHPGKQTPGPEGLLGRGVQVWKAGPWKERTVEDPAVFRIPSVTFKCDTGRTSSANPRAGLDINLYKMTMNGLFWEHELIMN